MKKLLFPILFLLVACQSTECGDKAFQQEYQHSMNIVENILKDYHQNPDTIRHAVFFLSAACDNDPFEFDYNTSSFSSEKAIKQNLQNWFNWFERNKCTTQLEEVEIAMARKRGEMGTASQ
jgi:hypothetical protein